MFINQNFAQNSKIHSLTKPITAWNVDGTINKKGTIKSYVELEFEINSRKFREQFYVTGLEKQKIILGFTRLQKYNPLIDWKTGKIEWKDWKFNSQKWVEQRKPKPKTTMEELPDKEELKNRTLYPTNENLNAILLELIEEGIQINKVTIATELAAEENQKKEEKTDAELVPQQYHEYLDIFSEEKAAWFPESRSWDHKIKMKEGFEPNKNYNLTLAEQLELDKFLKENVEKGYIWPSQSPMASPFFFVSKKDGKLWPCQDYCYLNNWMIRNSYPLPLISDILDKLKGAKYFTKLDVRWGYNNICIWKWDEWKAAFKTNKGLFEPTVMFFSMCNSPVTFQAMMNDIFVGMINGKLVIIYMDNILIFAKTKEELERNTKMVLAKLCEHNLFLKTNVPHKVEEVYEAAQFVLQGYTSFTQNIIASNSSQQLQQPQSPSNSPVDSTNTPVKTEDLSTLFAGFTKSIIEALQNTQHRSQPHANHSHEGKLECNYCGEEHFICDCPHVPHDIATGKCKRNQDGKVVLPSGAYVPRDITGKFLCNCINKWHRKNPNQLGAATLIHTINKRILNRQKSPSSSVY